MDDVAWHHVAGTWDQDAKVASIYIDGELRDRRIWPLCAQVCDTAEPRSATVSAWLWLDDDREQAAWLLGQPGGRDSLGRSLAESWGGQIVDGPARGQAFLSGGVDARHTVRPDPSLQVQDGDRTVAFWAQRTGGGAPPSCPSGGGSSTTASTPVPVWPSTSEAAPVGRSRTPTGKPRRRTESSPRCPTTSPRTRRLLTRRRSDG